MAQLSNRIFSSRLRRLKASNLGSTRLVTNSAGQVIFSTNYEPCGVAFGASGFETFMFNDKQFDSATNVHYYNARFYDSMIGRFITGDMIVRKMSDSMGHNLYVTRLGNWIPFLTFLGRIGI
jgi:RHS repeat-associated protein